MRAVILLALVGAAFAVPKTSQRIVGGVDTTIQQYPYMSNMQYGFFGVWWIPFCGGSLITVNSVLSASHCYVGDAPTSWRVVLGSTSANSGGNTHLVSQIIMHPQYDDETIVNDVAIIRLQTNAVLSNSIGLARIAGPNYILAPGTEVASIGWGALYQGGPSPDTLQHVFVNIIDQGICAERYAYLKTLPGYQLWPDITDEMLCAGILNVGGMDACQGDSGGPLAHSGDIIVGVTSWGFGCADSFYPGVNARVSALVDFITSNS